MTDPTRTQISADVTIPTYAVELYLSGSWVDVSSEVLNITIDVATSGDASGLSFGSAVQPTASVAFNALSVNREWRLTPIRISFGFATSNKVPRFSGVIVERRRDAQGGTWSCRGWDAIIEGTSIRSPVFVNRAIATKTTALLSDDPSTLSTYTGGIINYLLWQCGGRPYEQAGSYPLATFYYSCSNALIAPAFAWISGEGTWEALLRFVRAAGGQLYQDGLGVVRYVDPITMNTGSSTHLFTDAVLTAAQRVAQGASGYQSLSSSGTIQQAVSSVTAQFVTRTLQGVQTVFEDRTARYLAASQVLSVDCDLQLPIIALPTVTWSTIRIRDAVPVTIAAVITSWSAQRVTVQFTNNTSTPVQLDRITVIGQPIAVEEEGSATYSGTVTMQHARALTLEDNPWVQDRLHAEQLTRMVYDLYSQTGEIITLSGCAYDPDRFLGEIVSVTSADWSLSAVAHRIIAIRPRHGAWMDVDVCAIGSLPVNGDLFVIGTSYNASTTKKLGY